MMRVSTGIQGLDYILRGGLLPGRAYLFHGEPGTGKTTLGLHFLSAGDAGLLITFGQSADRLYADASSLGLNLNNVTILDLSPPPDTFAKMETYDIFSPAEVEREPVGRLISEAIAEKNPKRIFVDSFGQFRSLAPDEFHHRRLAQSFFRFATELGATLVVASTETDCARDVDGVISLVFSDKGRSLRVTKCRGSDFHAGHYPIHLTGAGLQVPLSAA